MPSLEKRLPVNLTAIAETLPQPVPGPEVCIRGMSGDCVLQVCGLEGAGEYASDGLADTVYVIASGYGVLHWGDTELECTAGDVLFVPGGHAHRFERRGGEIRIWRVSAAPRQVGVRMRG